MAIATTTNLPTLSAAAYSAWGSAISAALASIGLVQTTDTGQVNWTTVAGGAAPATSALVGYEIWKLNDSLQATKPVFFRVEYRTAVGAAYGFLQIIVGQGSNGAGTLTGTTITAAGTGGSIASAGDWRLCSDGSNLWILGGYGGNVNAVGKMCFLFSRTQNTDGTYNGDGWWFHSTGGNGTTPNLINCGYYSFTANTLWTDGINGLAALAIQRNLSLTSGADVYLSPLIVNIAGKIETPANCYGCYPADIADGATFVFNGHTFLALSTNESKCVPLNAQGGTNANGKHLIKWE